ncbi:MAG: flagellar hook-associated protein FlgK [Myxococcota bacterium]|nr:flagellar hook-associated protein FlgK [Myxococcota bacterium]
MIGLKNILRNAVSGMSASQVGLTTVGHNIANAGVEGYSRQQVHLGTRDPLRVVAGTQEMSQIGQGARVGNIMRAHDSFIEGQIMRDRLGKGFHGGRQQALAILERLVDNGASPTIGDRLDDFFNSLSELSQNPSSLGTREMVLESADRLASSFESMAVESREVQESIDRELREHVDKINSLADIVSQMNVAAGSIEASGKMANDFRDRRDQAIRELSDLIDIRVNAMPSGGHAISLANGFSLVQGDAVARLQLTPDPANNGLFGVEHVSTSGVVTDITRRLNQGEVGGLLDVRDRIVPTHMLEVDTLAFNINQEVNTIHQAGFGLDGVGNRDLFTQIAGIPGAALAMRLDPAIAGSPDQLAAATDPLAVPGDNRNLQDLVSIRDSRLPGLGSVTFTSYYAEIVRSVGSEVAQNTRNLDVQEARFNQSEALRNSIEGVSIDDEMVDLTRFQKHFEASARVMDTVNRLMDEIMSLVR